MIEQMGTQKENWEINPLTRVRIDTNQINHHQHKITVEQIDQKISFRFELCAENNTVWFFIHKTYQHLNSYTIQDDKLNEK